MVAAECFEGIEPLETVNEAIWRIGVLPRLAADVKVFLVSGLSLNQVQQTLVSYASRVEDVVDREDVLVLPRASQMIAHE